MPADVGADILDLAEIMITSNGLQYEPVSKASNGLKKKKIFTLLFTTAFLLFVCLFRLSLN